MKWVAGSNHPGCLPDSDPEEYPDWHSAREGMLGMLNDEYDSLFEVGRPTPGTALAYVEVRRIACFAPTDQPLSIFYRGRVYWLADVGGEG